LCADSFGICFSLSETRVSPEFAEPLELVQNSG
jgi:hypothetical protein